VIDDREAHEDEDAIGVVARYLAQKIRPVGRGFAWAVLWKARGQLDEALDLVDALAANVAVYRYSRERGISRMLAQIELTGDPKRRFVPSRHPMRVAYLGGDGRLVNVEVPTP
jgi:hypothetical protein